MFSYYGGKSKIINHYPAPKHTLIIEPFAGSARYSLKWDGIESPYFIGRHGTWINDKYDVIFKIWEYLKSVTPEEINSLPNLKLGDDLRNLGLNENQYLLMSFCIATGRAQPAYKVTAFGDKTSYPKDDPRWRPNSTWTLTKKKILENLHKIRDWNVTNLDYKDLPNIEATWYIDPPYQYGGDLYVENKIDYKELADWCMSRKGQVIVCENSKANWLPFKPLVQLCGQKHKTLEVIYTN